MIVNRAMLSCAVITGSLALCGVAQGDKYWVSTGTGNWSDPANWSDTGGGPGGAGVPGPAEAVSIWHTDNVDRNISLDISANVGSLGIAARHHDATTVFHHLSGAELQTTVTTLGRYYGKTFYQQYGGSHTTSFLNLGFSSGSHATYEISGGTLSAGAMDIGYHGYGKVVHSGGTVHVGTVQLARGTIYSGAGTYIMNGASASLIVTGNEMISYRSHGYFIQSAGNHVVQGTLYVGASGGGYGTYEMSGGSLTVGSALLVGSGNGTGTLLHSGGTIQVGTAQVPGNFFAKSYELSRASAALIVTGDHSGSFKQSAGYHKVGGTLTGNFELSGGLIDMSGPQIRNGTAIQSGGSLFASAPLRLHGTTYSLTGGTFTAPSLELYYFSRLTYGGGSLKVGTLQVHSGIFLVPHDSGITPVVEALTMVNGFGTWSTNRPQIDMTNNNMVIDYVTDPATQESELRSYLHEGWLFSSTAGAAHRLGYGDNADPLLQKSTFSGQSFPENDFSQILIMYTFGGDANLDGKVNLIDLVALATHWQKEDAYWTEGDFNYDGTVNSADLAVLAASWQASEASLSLAVQEAGLPVAAIPEPGTAVGCLIGVTAIIRFRARKRLIH